MLPWNWIKCCKNEHSKVDENSKIDKVDEYSKVDVHNEHSEQYLITEPISNIICNLAIVENISWTDEQLYCIYMLHDKELVLKEQKSQLNFSTFVTNKDFLSWLFGQSNQNNYILLAGTKTHWNKVAYTGTYHHNRLYKAVHKESRVVYVILANLPFQKESLCVTPSERINEINDRLNERNNLSKPARNEFNPLAYNS